MMPTSSLDDKGVLANEKPWSDIQEDDAKVPVENIQIARGNNDNLHRRLNNRQIQLIAIGGSIGTGLFVSIGGALHHGGPASLLLAYTLYSVMLALVNNGIAEMSTYMPVSGGFVRLAGHWVDDALGFMVGWNFFFYEALVIPFEITALSLLISYWSDKVPVVAVCLVCTALYGALNIFAVRAYGEAEFWLSGGKVILLIVLFFFTFITMVGGNPQHDAYGFRYWDQPGPFAEYMSTGNLGKFEGFLAALWNASFVIVGPEYISMVAAEAKHPRIYIKNAFKTIYWRFGLFFIGSAIAVGIVVAYNDPVLVAVLSGTVSGSGTGAASPYVIAMNRLKIKILPDFVNALMITSVFSAGNTYTYTAIRTLYGMALEGRAPRIFSKTTNNGVPIYAFGLVMLFPLLSLLQLSSASSTVLTWLINLVTASTVIDYIVMSITYICFYNACKAQGLDRSKLPYKGWFQPYCAYISLAWMTAIVFTYGYSSFVPWSVGSFFTYYTMLLLAPILFIFWKFWHRTHWLRPDEVDLKWESDTIYAYEASTDDKIQGFWEEVVAMSALRKPILRNKINA